MDGKRHYGDGLYREAEKLLRVGQSQLKTLKSTSIHIELCLRKHELSWSHHYEVVSLKQIEEKSGKLQLSTKPDQDKMQEFLAKAEKNGWSVRELRDQVKTYRTHQEQGIELANEAERGAGQGGVSWRGRGQIDYPQPPGAIIKV